MTKPAIDSEVLSVADRLNQSIKPTGEIEGFDSFNEALAPLHSMQSEIQNELNLVMRNMEPQNVALVLAYYDGGKQAAIARRFGVHRVTVARACASKWGKRMIELLNGLRVLETGLSDADMRFMLSDIACKNRAKDPRVSLTALSELHKMNQHRENLDMKAHKGDVTHLEISISPALAPTELDVNTLGDEHINHDNLITYNGRTIESD